MMDQYLAEMYGTPGHDEQKEKLAQVEIFSKLAADQDIDLNKLTDEQVSELWDATFSEDDTEKTAEAEGANVDELYAQAQQEVSGALSQGELQKQADAFGKQAAHAFYAELNEIEKAAASGTDLEAARALHGGKGAKKDGLSSKIEDLKRSPGYQKAQNLMRGAKGKAEDVMRSPAVQKTKNLAKTRGGKAGLLAAGMLGAGAAGAQAYKSLKGNDKKASALDQLAGQLAFEKAAEAGWNGEELAERINAVLVLGPGESEKIAYAADTDEAIEVRSLELLEMAGYPVEWE